MRIAVSWILIVASIAAIALSDAISKSRQVSNVSDLSEFRLEMGSRYLLGNFQITQQSGAVVGSMADDLWRSATTPEDQIRLIPVIAETEGKTQALRQLSKIDETKATDSQIHDIDVLDALYTTGNLPADDRQQLIDTYGWSGKLAAAQADGPNSEMHQEVNRAALRTFISTIVALLLFGGAFFGGLTLLIVFTIQFIHHRMPPQFHPADSPMADAMLEGFAVYLLSMMILLVGLPLVARVTHWHIHGLGWETLLLIPVILALLWVHQRGGSWPALGEALGWNRGRGIPREMLAGICGYLAGIPILIIGAIITSFLVGRSGANAEHPLFEHPLVDDLLNGGWPRLFLLFLACVFAPITEELMFRGMLLGHLRRRFSWPISAIVVSLIFAGIHPQGWAAIPVLGSIALVLAALREQRGSLVASMTAHALNNASVLVMFVLVMG